MSDPALISLLSELTDANELQREHIEFLTEEAAANRSEAQEMHATIQTGTPAIPATAATDEDPAAAAVPAKDPVYAIVPFKDLLPEKWDWVKWERYENCEVLHEKLSGNTSGGSESTLPMHVFHRNIASNNHEGKPRYIHLGPLVTAYRASILSDPCQSQH